MIPGSNSPKSEVRSPKSSRLGTFRSSDIGHRTSDIGRRTSDERGFTFVELMIVLVVIGILVTLAQPSFSTSVWRAKEATLKENLFIFRDVINQYYADNGQYPSTLEALVEMRYLRRIPKDPITGVDDTWLIVPAVDEFGQDQGIFDIRSGSDMLAMDGTSYQEW